MPATPAEVMERRYAVPYNWLEPAYSIRWAGKQGMCDIITGWIQPGAALLDIGCGDGWYASRYVQSGAAVSGIDISARSVGFASLLVPSGTFAVASAAALPYADASFDVVTCIQVLEHMTEEDITRALTECRRVLRPSGALIVSVPSVRRPLSAAHLRHYTTATIQATLAPYGTIEAMVGQEYDHPITLGMRKCFENRFWFLPRAARWFYTKLYFPRWNRVAAEEGRNIFCLVRMNNLYR